MKSKGAKYMLTERDLTSGGERAVQYTGDVSQNFTLETHIMLLTDLTLINLIKKDMSIFTLNHFSTIFFLMENFTIYFYPLF